jgi:hypothetical protein
MTLKEVQALWIYAMREAYICGVRDGLNQTNRVNTFLEVDPEIQKVFESWEGESK